MRMGNRFDRLPKGVQKLVKRLANIEREELKTLRAGYTDCFRLALASDVIVNLHGVSIRSF